MAIFFKAENMRLRKHYHAHNIPSKNLTFYDMHDETIFDVNGTNSKSLKQGSSLWLAGDFNARTVIKDDKT